MISGEVFVMDQRFLRRVNEMASERKEGKKKKKSFLIKKIMKLISRIILSTRVVCVESDKTFTLQFCVRINKIILLQL